MKAVSKLRLIQSTVSDSLTTLASACKSSTDPSQAWLFRWPEDRWYPGIQWVGKTDYEGTNPQGGCGIFGYKSYNKGVPQVAADKAISLGCYQTTTPIRFVEDLD